ncbi:MAG: six-cysteine ranthipeptide SCIFF [Clostridiales bacterium]|nr:six-cysteine ranthipeptide SCIFF [Clostridiales bacterium]
MEHIRTIGGNVISASVSAGGCGECQASCQSACKTSCTVANQPCENEARK